MRLCSLVGSCTRNTAVRKKTVYRVNVCNIYMYVTQSIYSSTYVTLTLTVLAHNATVYIYQLTYHTSCLFFAGAIFPILVESQCYIISYFVKCFLSKKGKIKSAGYIIKRWRQRQQVAVVARGWWWGGGKVWPPAMSSSALNSALTLTLL